MSPVVKIGLSFIFLVFAFIFGFGFIIIVAVSGGGGIPTAAPASSGVSLQTVNADLLPPDIPHKVLAVDNDISEISFTTSSGNIVPTNLINSGVNVGSGIPTTTLPIGSSGSSGTTSSSNTSKSSKTELCQIPKSVLIAQQYVNDPTFDTKEVTSSSEFLAAKTNLSIPITLRMLFSHTISLVQKVNSELNTVSSSGLLGSSGYTSASSGVYSSGSSGVTSSSGIITSSSGIYVGAGLPPPPPGAPATGYPQGELGLAQLPATTIEDWSNGLWEFSKTAPITPSALNLSLRKLGARDRIAPYNAADSSYLEAEVLCYYGTSKSLLGGLIAYECSPLGAGKINKTCVYNAIKIFIYSDVFGGKFKLPANAG